MSGTASRRISVGLPSIWLKSGRSTSTDAKGTSACAERRTPSAHPIKRTTRRPRIVVVGYVRAPVSSLLLLPLQQIALGRPGYGTHHVGAVLKTYPKTMGRRV